MTIKKVNPAEASASAKFSTAALKPDQMVTETEKRAEVIKKHPSYAGSPEVQQGLTAWLTAATAVAADTQKINAARLALTALLALVLKDEAAWRRATKKMLAIIDSMCGGSAQAIKEWGFTVATRNLLVATTDAPQGLRAGYTRAFVLVVRWDGVVGHLGYMLQIGDGTPQGWGASIACPKAKYEPVGLIPGQKVAFRVAVQRKNGLSVWSDALTITVR